MSFKILRSFQLTAVLLAALLLSSCSDDSESKEGTAQDQDGNTFKTIRIGSQIWSAENLNVSTFLNGGEPFEVNSEDEWELAIEHQFPAYCYYDFNPANGPKYGKLYNWFAVNHASGLAPEGWHIATDAEWTTLANTLGGVEMAGFKIKAEDWNGDNSSGFNAQPAGMYNGLFSGLGTYTGWWTSTSQVSTNPWQRYANGDNELIRGYYNDESVFQSIRLVKD